MRDEDEAFYSAEEENFAVEEDKSNEKVDNDEITPNEEGFLQGYEDTEEDKDADNPYAEATDDEK
jgi:hypothetical protein